MGRFQTVLAVRERRKTHRYDVLVSASITVDDASLPQRCTIHDISQTGALIEVENAEGLDSFTLTFTRECRIVRRNVRGNKVGVEFLLPWSVPSATTD
ncbi:MAG TPA: PilZ domain-containing protein [Pseudolabrys sp.]|nr:PilZ domain-containing protein [Pseudolabrys sp.]